MSVVVAVERAGQIVIGADTQFWDGSVAQRGPGKLVRHGGFVVGCCGAGFVQRMVSACIEHLPDFDAFSDACTTWSRDNGHGHAGSDGHWSAPWVLVIASPDGLWTLAGDGSVFRVVAGYVAIGSGNAVAIGVLHSHHGGDMSAEAQVRLALAAAEAHADGVGGPFDVVVLRK